MLTQHTAVARSVKARVTRQGGVMLPSRAVLYAALLGTEAFFELRIDFWRRQARELYGIDLGVFAYVKSVPVRGVRVPADPARPARAALPRGNEWQ